MSSNTQLSTRAPHHAIIIDSFYRRIQLPCTFQLCNILTDQQGGNML